MHSEQIELVTYMYHEGYIYPETLPSQHTFQPAQHHSPEGDKYSDKIISPPHTQAHREMKTSKKVGKPENEATSYQPPDFISCLIKICGGSGSCNLSVNHAANLERGSHKGLTQPGVGITQNKGLPGRVQRRDWWLQSQPSYCPSSHSL